MTQRIRALRICINVTVRCDVQQGEKSNISNYQATDIQGHSQEEKHPVVYAGRMMSLSSLGARGGQGEAHDDLMTASH